MWIVPVAISATQIVMVVVERATANYKTIMVSPLSIIYFY
jgi:hypothetical protein